MTPTKARRHKDAREMLETWDRGDAVQAIEMGGISPGYEQTIQILIVEMVRDNIDRPLPEPDSSEGETWGDATVRRINDGYSGAQVGAAKSVAYRILRDGYRKTLASMREHDKSRLFLASRHWPKTPEPPAAPTTEDGANGR